MFGLFFKRADREVTNRARFMTASPGSPYCRGIYFRSVRASMVERKPSSTWLTARPFPAFHYFLSFSRNYLRHFSFSSSPVNFDPSSHSAISRNAGCYNGSIRENVWHVSLSHTYFSTYLPSPFNRPWCSRSVALDFPRALIWRTSDAFLNIGE